MAVKICLNFHKSCVHITSNYCNLLLTIRYVFGSQLLNTIHTMSGVDNVGQDQNKDTTEYVEDGKNKNVVKCKYCDSKILDKKAAEYITLEKHLPLMLQKSNESSNDVENEVVKEFYHVENMYTFENIGFTHTVANCKYLSCADCDAGPVGYYDMDTKHSYVALSRVIHT